MAKLLFLQSLEYEFLGSMYISSMLKQHGHDVRLKIGNRINDFRKIISTYQPNFVGFSIMSGNHQWALSIARQIKREFGVPNIFGGSHPTFFPEFVKEEGVDIIVRGEGEEACLELMDRFDQRRDFIDVKNLLVSRNGKIYANEVRPLREDLDYYPFPDRQLYSDLRGHIDLSVRNFITSRGCPWHCTFCFNDSMRELYRGKGKYVRIRDVDKVIEEARILRDTAGTKLIYFADDVFGLDKNWLYEFLQRYKREVGLPFVCLVRADVVCSDERYVQYLVDAGCKSVFFGIESGNERLRNNLLGKSLTNAQIYKAANLLHKAGIKFRTYNILGLPGETLEDALLTIQLNIDIKADYPWCSLFLPFPGTALTRYAVDKGYISKSFNIDQLSKSFFANSNLINQPHINELQNLQRFFQLAVLRPWTFPIIKRLIRLPSNIFFTAIFGIVYFLVHIRSEQKKFLQTLRFGLKNYKHLLTMK